MKASLFIELQRILEKEEVFVNPAVINRLINKSDEIIKKIINSKYKGEILEYILDCNVTEKDISFIIDVFDKYKEDDDVWEYVSDLMYTSYDNDTKRKLFEIISKASPDKRTYIHNVIENEEVNNKGYAVKLAKIIANAKGKEQAEYARDVVYDQNVLASPYAIELTKIVANAKGGDQARFARDVAYNKGVLASPYAVELTKIVANAKGTAQARFARDVAYDENVLKSPHTIELTEIVVNAKGKEHAYHAARIAYNVDVLSSPYAVDLTKTVVNAKGEDQAKYARDVAYNKGVLASPYAVELTKIVANAKGTAQAKNASYVACDKNVLNSPFAIPYAIELTNIVANAKGEDQASCVEIIIKKFSGYEHICELASFVANENRAIISNFVVRLLWLNMDPSFIYEMINVLGSRVNINNLNVILSLILTGEYKKSSEPFENFKTILNSTNNYEKFDKVYVDDASYATKGLKEMNKMFNDLDLNKDTYVKSKNKRNSNVKETE